VEIQEKYNYGGWKNCIKLSNGKIELVVTTDVGPRIIKFGAAGGRNLFKEFKETLGSIGGDKWNSYGGHRLWHAPEQIPRTYFPDNFKVPYSIQNNTLILSQEIEKTTGIKKEIEVTLFEDENYVKVLHRIINKNLWDVELAPWAITVMTEGTRAIIPQEPYQSHIENLLPVRQIALWSYTEMGDSRFKWGNKYIQVTQDSSKDSCQKIGCKNTLGWVAGYLDGEIFVKRYPYDEFAIYPDLGCNTEIYTDKNILEIETLNTLDLLPHEGFVTHTEYWFYFNELLDEDENSIDKKLLPLIKKTNKYCKF